MQASQSNQITQQLKNPNLQEADQLVMYKRGQERTAKNKFN